MLTQVQYIKLMRASALYDLIVTVAFVTPWSFAALMAVVAWGHVALGLPGSVPDLDLWHVLFANLMGSVVVVWAALRLHLGLAVLGRYDMVTRFLFAAWQVHALALGGTWMLIGFLVAELAFGFAQALPYRKAERS